MADNDSDILAQFQEFLDAKAAADKENSDAEDFDIEIWDEKGRGVRTKRSHAKPFLQSLGIDLDPESTSEPDTKGGKTSPKTQKTGTPTPPTSTVRKYFAKPQGT